ncbi:MAG: hypothetical protein ACI92E_000417 [Oceanicoccus sp.]|jgi:hypothetical protein
MKIIKIAATIVLALFVLLIAFYNVRGMLTLGTIEPALDPVRDISANKIVLVMGATGSVGDGLLKAAIEDPNVAKIHVITRRSSARIEAGVASGKVTMLEHQDFTDFSSFETELAEVNTVLWGLGVSSIGTDEVLYKKIQLDFPVAFTKQWLAVRNTGPMAFHYITGMGTDGDAGWAKVKRQAELELTAMAENTPLRTFHYRSAFVRPTAEQSNAFHYLLEALFTPGSMVISAKELGQCMLEIGIRTKELTNGAIIDNADSIAYADTYRTE